MSRILGAFFAGLLCEMAVVVVVLLAYMLLTGQATGWGAIGRAFVGALIALAFVVMTIAIGLWAQGTGDMDDRPF